MLSYDYSQHIPKRAVGAAFNRRSTMGDTVAIAIISDLDQGSHGYQETNDALFHAAGRLSTEVDISWLPTQSVLESDWQQRLRHFAGIWGGPGVYQSQEGALKGIRFARELDWPFIGT
jgi:CTP synthase (UTP-ammonia lyase)